MYNPKLKTDSSVNEQALNLVTNAWGWNFNPFSCYVPAPYGIYDKEYDKVAEKYPSVLQIFSVGNDRKFCSGGYKTAGWKMKNVLFVGAVDNNDRLGDFSSCGPLNDGRIVPHIVGMGVDVYSTELNNRYMLMSGTSMSTPGVTGCMALLYEAYKKEYDEFPLSSLAKAIVCNTAIDLGNAGPDYQYGFGRIDILKAIESVENNSFFTGEVRSNSVSEHSIDVDSGVKELKVTLVWTDVAGYEGASKALVNDLDLVIVTPAGEKILPFILNPSSPSDIAIKGVDNLNNIEQVIIPNPQVGKYKIQIKGTKVQTESDYSIAFLAKKEELKITYPIGNEKLVSGSEEFVRWNTSNTNDPVAIYFSKDNGVSWEEIAKEINPLNTNYKISLPAIESDQCKFKIQQGSLNSISELFIISSVPEFIEIKPNFESTVVRWNKVKDAKSYKLYKISEGEINLVQTVTDTFYNVTGLETDNKYYFSVLSQFEDFDTQRNIAERSIPIPKVDLEIKTVVNPLGGALLSDEESVIVRIINKGAEKLLKGDTFQAKYTLNDGTPVEETITLEKDIERDEVFDYTFIKKLYLSIEKYYNLKIEITHEEDSVYTSNNIFEWQFLHYKEINEYPYVETFNQMPDLRLVNITDHIYLGRGWVNNYLTDDFEWWPWNSDTYKDGTGPAKDHTSGKGKFLYTESFFLNGKQGNFELFTPYFNISSLTKPVVSFWYHMFAESMEMGSLHVDIYSVVEDKWYNDVLTILGSQGDKWQKQLLDISDYKNKGLIRLKYRVTSTDNYQNAIALDDFELYEGDIYDLKIDSVGINEDGGLLANNEKVRIYYSNIGGREISVGEKISFRYTLNNNDQVIEDWVVTEPIKIGDNSFYEFTAAANLSDITTRNIMDFEARFIRDNKAANNKMKNVIVQSYNEPESKCQAGYYYLGLYNFFFEGNYEETYIENYLSMCATTEILGYSFYGDKVAEVYRGKEYKIAAQPHPFAAMEGVYPMGQYVKAWIDFNQNGVFEVDEEVYEVDHRAVMYLADNVEIPEDALLGFTRLRVRTSLYKEDLIGEGAAHKNFKYGETEDYTIEIKEESKINIALSNFFTSPNTFSNLGSNEVIGVKISNTGLQDISAGSEINLSYNLDGSFVTEKLNLTNAILVGQATYYTFKKTLDLSAKGKHVIKTWCNLEGDNDNYNDTLYLSVINLSEKDPVNYFEDFESIEQQDWFAASTKNKKVWELGQPSTVNLNVAHSGNICWGTVLDSVYLPRNESILYSPVFDFTNANTASISFWINSIAEPNYDGMILESSLNGKQWNKVGEGEYDFYNSDYKGSANLGAQFWSENSEGWKKKEIEVNEFCGKKVAFRFRFNSDDNQVYEGFTFDDFKIEVNGGTTSIHQILEDEYKVYPNPFNDEVFINLSENSMKIKAVRLVDMSGVIRFDKDIKNNNSIIYFDTKELTPGLYSLLIITDKETYSKLIVKN